jgi:hypothetical protein
VLALAADLWIFVILIPLGLVDYLYDRQQATPAKQPPARSAPSRRRVPSGRHALTADALAVAAVRVSADEPVGPEGIEQSSGNDAGQTEARIQAAKPALSPRGAQVAFATYSALAVMLWLFMLAMGHQPGAAAAMHALQG